MNKENKSKKIVFIVIFIIILLILGFVLINQNKTKPTNKNDNKSISTEEIIGLKELDINSDLVKNLVFPAANTNLHIGGIYPIYWDFFNTNVVMMDRDYKIISAQKHAKIETSTEKTRYKNYITSKEMEKALKKVFGPDEKIEHTYLTAENRNICGVIGDYDTKKKIYHDFGDCIVLESPFKTMIESKIIRAEQDNEAVYVYSDFVYVSGHNGKYDFYDKLPVINIVSPGLKTEEELKPPQLLYSTRDLQKGIDTLSEEGKLKTYKYTFKNNLMVNIISIEEILWKLKKTKSLNQGFLLCLLKFFLIPYIYRYPYQEHQ